MPQSGTATFDIVKIFVSATQKAATVRDMVRLIVLDSMKKFDNAETTNISLCNKRQTAKNAKCGGACIPIGQSSPGKYLLLEGTGIEDEESDDEY